MAQIRKEQYTERGMAAPRFAEKNPNTASTEGRMFQTLGDETGDIADNLEKAHAVAEEAKAKNIYESSQAEILSRAAQEQDLTPEKQKLYHNELNSALHAASESISIPEYKGLFKAKYSAKQEISNLKVNSIFLKRYRDQARAEFQKSKAIQGANYVTANNPTEKSMYISELYSDIDAQVQSGYMKREEGEKEKQKTVALWNKNHMQNDLETRPKWLLEEAQKGEKGFYQGVNPAFRANIIEQAKKRIHSLDLINRNNTEDDMMKKQISGALTPEEVEEKYLNKSISRSFYDKMKAAIDSPVGPTADTDPVTFYDLTSAMIEPNTTPAQAREKLIQAQAEGKLSYQDFQKLYNMHLLATDEGPQSVGDLVGPKGQGDFITVKALSDARQKQLTDKKNGWHSAFKFIDHTLENDQKAVTKARQALYDRLPSNQPIDPKTLTDEAKKVLFEGFVQQYPQVKAFPKEGKVMVASGVKFRFYPDRMPEEEK